MLPPSLEVFAVLLNAFHLLVVEVQLDTVDGYHLLDFFILALPLDKLELFEAVHRPKLKIFDAASEGKLVFAEFGGFLVFRFGVVPKGLHPHFNFLDGDCEIIENSLKKAHSLVLLVVLHGLQLAFQALPNFLKCIFYFGLGELRIWLAQHAPVAWPLDFQYHV